MLAAKPAPGFAVDAQAGVISNVALLTVGEALGHGFYIDEKTIATALDAVQRNGGRLRVYPTHEHSGYPHWSSHDCDDAGSELNMAAYTENLSASSKGDQLVGGRLEFYQAFRKNYGPQFDQIIETAAKTPDLIGLSLEPVGHFVYVGKDGTEYAGFPEGVDLAYDGMPALRVDELYSCAFGSVVAANPGLFAKLSAKFGGKQKKLRKLAAAVVEMLEHPEAGKVKGDAPASAADLGASTQVHTQTPTVSTDSTPNLSHENPTMKIIADLKAKYGSDAQKFSQAMTLVGHKPDITMDALEAALVQQDLAAATGQVAKLTTDLAASNAKVTDLEGKLATANQEVTNLKAQIQQMKDGGTTAVNLGATSAGAGVAAAVNPYAKGAVNLSAQAKLERENPTLAAQLKSAAASAAK